MSSKGGKTRSGRASADGVTNMNDDRKTKVVKLPARDCDEELLRMNRNPVFGVVALPRTPQELSPQLPDIFEAVDRHALMERLRALASQI